MIALQVTKDLQGTFGIGRRYEDMIVVIRRHNVGADAMMRQPVRHRSGEANGLQA